MGQRPNNLIHNYFRNKNENRLLLMIYRVFQIDDVLTFDIYIIVLLVKNLQKYKNAKFPNL